MRCGVSTACFYPLDTLESLKRLADSGVPVVELFFCTDSELNDAYLARVVDVTLGAGMEISSAHPFTALMEGFYFATPYKARPRDGLKLYRRYYEACRVLGCGKLVFHGDHDYNVKLFPAAQYAHNFKALAALGREHGVTLCHENVSYCRLGYPERVRELRPLLGQDAAFVLDLKQAQRNKVPVHCMLQAMRGAVQQVHISDHNQSETCLAPGAGEMDFLRFFRSLGGAGYNGDVIIELYSDNYGSQAELIRSFQYVRKVLGQYEQTKGETA